MTLELFGSLTKQRKKETLLRSASFLAERKWAMFKVMLYQVDNFYTEVFFFKGSPKAILYRSFFSTKPLQPYLNQIDLSDIVEEMAP